MNKTIIININGFVFHIEEDAYEALKNYMTDVKRHFLNSADSLEITTDIENRIAEMFTEILARENKQVIIEQDVKAVIQQMGTVQDFENAEEEPQAAAGSAYYSNTESRRLFRDPDDHLIGGVCAGIANYFDIKAMWIRLLFAVAFVFFGTGLFLYIILWIVIPKAITRADRMSMKGEKLNLQGFKRNFEEEMNNVQGQFANMRHEARPFIYKSRDFIGDFFTHLGTFLGGTGKVLIKLLGIAIMLGCVGMLIALGVGLFTFIVYGNTNIYHLFPFDIASSDNNVIFLLSGFVLFALPLLGIILLTTRIIFNKQVVTRSGGFAMLIVWIVAFSVVIYYSAKLAAEFKSGASFSQTVSIKPTANNTYYLKLNDIRYLSAEDSARLNINERFRGKIILNDDEDEIDMESPGNNVTIEIERSDVAQPVLIESYSARGRNYEDALTNAQNVTYQFVQQDSVLKFDRRLRKMKGKLWRNQEIHLILKVPMKATLVIEEEVDRYLRGVSIRDCIENGGNDKATAGVFVMTENGLQCKYEMPTVITDTVYTDTVRVRKDSVRRDTVIVRKP